jgi:hypothetical protein
MQEQTVFEAMIESYSKQKLGANVGWNDENSARKLHEIPLRGLFRQCAVETVLSL